MCRRTLIRLDLDEIGSYLQQVRAAGLKAIVRFRYTNEDEGEMDATPARTLHIQSLQSTLIENSDVIFVLQAGSLESTESGIKRIIGVILEHGPNKIHRIAQSWSTKCWLHWPLVAPYSSELRFIVPICLEIHILVMMVAICRGWVFLMIAFLPAIRMWEHIENLPIGIGL